MKKNHLQQLIKEELSKALREYEPDERRRNVRDEPFDDSAKYAEFGEPNLQNVQSMAYRVYQLAKSNPKVKIVQKAGPSNPQTGVRSPKLTDLTIDIPNLYGGVERYIFSTEGNDYTLKSHTLDPKKVFSDTGRMIPQSPKNYHERPLQWEKYASREISNRR